MAPPTTTWLCPPKWQPLIDWLSASFPYDVAMPCLPGTKKPLFCHSGSSTNSRNNKKQHHHHRKWHWEDLHYFLKYSPAQQPYDIGILLRELCVIDVDCLDLCQELEAKFPVLLTVPCESTRKGKHYYFRRSAKADRCGFYDGRAQVRQGIDFKSVCRTGTSGFIVTAPSQGKSWLRAPWDSAIIVPDIPDDLLAAVAIAHHHPVTANFVFAEDDGQQLLLQVKSNPWLSRFQCLAPLFVDDNDDNDDILATTTNNNSDAAAAAAPTIPIGVGTAQHMEELLWMCDHMRLREWPMHNNNNSLQALRQLADYLGVPSSINALLLSSWHPQSISARLEALDRISPRWAQLAASPGPLVDLPCDCQFEPLDSIRDEQWLFHARDAAIPAYDQVLRPDPLEYAEASLPKPVLSLLHKYPNNVLLAGGAALSIASDCVAEGSDYDLFLWGADSDTAEAIKQDLLLQQPKISVSGQTGNALTVVWQNDDGDGDDDVVIQLITWLFKTPEHVLDSFDLAPCKVALGYFGGPTLALKARAACLESLRHMTCWVDISCWSHASVPRILKYYAKNFDVVIPGLQRKAFRVRDPANFPAEQPGISNLFKVEALAAAQHTNNKERPTYEQLHALLRKHCAGLYRHSAYTELIPTSVFAHVLHVLLTAGKTWLGLIFFGHNNNNTKPPPPQQPPASWKPAPLTGCLMPASPRCSAAFDYSVLRNAAACC